MNKWEIITASTPAILPGRLKMLWQYVIMGKLPIYTLTAWAEPCSKTLANIALHLKWAKKE